MKQHLKLDVRAAPGHPQKAMSDLGITYQVAVPQSINDSWWFFNCENVPDPLPDFLAPMKFQPHDLIGYGLSKEDADAIVANP